MIIGGVLFFTAVVIIVVVVVVAANDSTKNTSGGPGGNNDAKSSIRTNNSEDTRNSGTDTITSVCKTTPFSSDCYATVKGYCTDEKNVEKLVCSDFLSVVKFPEDNNNTFPTNQEVIMNASYIREGSRAYVSDYSEFITLFAYYTLYLGKDPAIVNLLASKFTVLDRHDFAALALQILSETLNIDNTHRALLKHFQQTASYKTPVIPMREFRQIQDSVVSSSVTLPSRTKSWDVLSHREFHDRDVPGEPCWMDMSGDDPQCITTDLPTCGAASISPYRGICPTCVDDNGTVGYETVSRDNAQKTFFDPSDCECVFPDPPLCIKRTSHDTVHGRYDDFYHYTKVNDSLVPLLDDDGDQISTRTFLGEHQPREVGVPLPQDWDGLQRRNSRQPMEWVQQLFHALTGQRYTSVDNPFSNVGTVESLAERPAGCWFEDESWCSSDRPTWQAAFTKDELDGELLGYLGDALFRYCQDTPYTFDVAGLYDCTTQTFRGYGAL